MSKMIVLGAVLPIMEKEVQILNLIVCLSLRLSCTIANINTFYIPVILHMLSKIFT